MKPRCLIALSRADDRGGVQVFVETLAQRLTPDYDVSLLVGRDGALGIGVPAETVLNLGARNDLAILMRLLGAKARRTIAAADIVIANSTAMSIGTCLLARLFKTKVIFVAHGLASRYQPRYLRPLVSLLEHITVALADIAVFLNSADHDAFGWKRRRQVIPNGIVIPPTPRVASSREGMRFLAVMRHTPQKDFPALGEFVREVMEARDALTVVGDGPDFAKNRRLLTIEGKQVRLIPQAREMDPIYREHDVFLLLSRSEGMPLSLLEAMSHGLAPIVSALPGTQDVVEDGISGFLLASNTAGELVQCVQRLREPGKRAAFGAAAHQRIQERFTLDACVTAYKEAIEAMVRQ